MWSRLRWPGLVALVAIDVVLVGMALRPPDSSSAVSRTATSTSTATSAASSAVSSSSTSSSTTTEALPRAERLDTLLQAVDTSNAWRAAVGSCDNGGATFEVTTDGGASWQPQDLPLSFIGRIKATSATVGFAVGAAQDCTPVVLGTGDGGASWSPPGPADSTWALDPASKTGLVRPGGDVATPCNNHVVADLNVVSDTAADVLCGNGRIKSTDDAGQSWTTLATIDGTLALSDPGNLDAAVVIAGVSRSCDGLSVGTVSTEGKSKEASCLDVGSTPSPGSVAISVSGDTGWVLVGDKAWQTSGGLDSWDAVSSG